MGNLCCCIKKNETESSLIIADKTCPYCNHVFNSIKEKKKHERVCLYNRGDNRSGFKNTDIRNKPSIYSDSYISNNKL